MLPVVAIYIYPTSREFVLKEDPPQYLRRWRVPAPRTCSISTSSVSSAPFSSKKGEPDADKLVLRRHQMVIQRWLGRGLVVEPVEANCLLAKRSLSHVVT